MGIAEDLSAARFIIRSYDDRRGCQTVEELRLALLANFFDRSVTVHYKRHTGVIASLFVDVSSAGVTESYGQKRLVNWNALHDLSL